MLTRGIEKNRILSLFLCPPPSLSPYLLSLLLLDLRRMEKARRKSSVSEKMIGTMYS